MGMIYKKFMSNSCNTEVELGVVVPIEYKHIFIMLHGYGGSIEEVERRFPLVEYASKNHLLIVVPELGNGFYLDRQDIDGEEDFVVSEFLCKELPSYIKKTYGMSDETGIILGGYSMGGFGTMLHGLNNADNFIALISVSGAFIANEIAFGSEFVVGTEKQRKEAFDVFMIKEGELPIEVLLHDIRRNPEATARYMPEMKKENIPMIILTCATKDIWCATTQRMKSLMLEKNIPFHYLEIEDGVHGFKEFDQGFRFALDKIFRE